MLRRHAAALRLSLMAADAASALLLFIVLSAVRLGATWADAWRAVGVDPVFLAALYAATWVATLWLLGLYRLRARWSWRSEWTDVLRAVLLVAVATFAFLFLAKLPDVSRLFLFSLFASQAVVTVFSRVVVRRVYAYARSRGYNASYILIVGDGPAARSFASRLARHRSLGLQVVGFVEGPRSDAPPGATSPARQPPPRFTPEELVALASQEPPAVLGPFGDLPDILHALVVDEVAICLPPESLAFVEPVARLCEEEGKVVRIPLDDVTFTLPGGRVEMFDGIPVMSLVYGPDRAVALIVKRIIDVVGAAAAIVLLAPIVGLIGIAIWARDGRPILFRQVRVGLHGRQLEIVKFRTMTPDAETRLAELAALNEIGGPAFKVSADPRVTRTGRFLRRTSLDELPQFWNVLRGEMSLVGPRPPLVSEVAGYDVWHRRRLAMKPGLTGLWQTSARREADFDRWVKLDLEYIDRWSLWLDLKIMARTIPAMLQGR